MHSSIAHKFRHRSTLFIATESQASQQRDYLFITVKRNLNDKLKVSNAEILAFSYARKLHRSMCYRSRLLISKFNARGSGYVLERRFTKFSEIMQSKGHYAFQGHSMSPILVLIESSYTTFY